MTVQQPLGAFEALLQEERRYPPPEAFRAQANVRDPAVYDEAARDLEGFWAKQAEQLDWFRRWDRVLEWNPPWAKWFVGGQLNACYNCVDRHTRTWRRNKAALIWEGEPGDERVLTYQDVYRAVNRVALALKQSGIQKGETVAIYLPMIPELPIAMLACARIGAPHTVIFGGFSPDAIRDRLNDCQAKLVITADAGYRRGNLVPLKDNVDEALQGAPSVRQVVVYPRVGGSVRPVQMQAGRDVWWGDWLGAVQERECPPEPLDAEHPLYILYTSGTTGKPKGVLHTTAGYLLGTSLTHRWIFDLKDEDVYWCTADIGWVTGHSYVVYGPMANGATQVIFEGTPDYPDKDRWWRIIEKYRVTILYTAPTAIRGFMRWGVEYPRRCDLSSLRLLGTVGEPINPEAWVWYHENIGGGRCPVVDTWWQTETGMILISPLPGITTLKPGSATLPFPGVEPDIVDEQGQPVPVDRGGYLILRKPWPAMMRTIWGDPDRYVQQYWSRFPGNYFTGDGARRDRDGYFWLLGRVDDVLNVAGHRIGTMEVESALVSHPAVAEAAVIGISHELKGQAVAAFVTPRAGTTPNDALAEELREHVAKKIGAIARPDRVFFTAELPKTRSAKIMRRLLRDIAEGRVLGDTTTLTDPSVLAEIKKQYEEQES
ncbi:MAG TPA: acetate--CoA ligase [Chloroflexota bacterium]|jgi:acetyl-CoA synthetase|nr:acetate--CoA ligase [Chloroflexota bacterium]